MVAVYFLIAIFTSLVTVASIQLAMEDTGDKGLKIASGVIGYVFLLATYYLIVLILNIAKETLWIS